MNRLDSTTNPDAGDIWLWVAIVADAKIVPAWYLGDRSAACAHAFMLDLASRLKNRVQLTSDGHRAYLDAVDWAFPRQHDYSMLVKMYGNDRESEVRYSPAECIGCRSQVITGRPDPKHISTSFAERQNLSVRMGLRRYPRLTNAFSRKLENHAAAVALYYFSYNFVKIHRTLCVTPAMASGVTDRLWEVSDLVALLEAEERGLEKSGIVISQDMDDEKRIGALLDLAKQHMQRCHELEDIEWKINFSIWGFLGGLAYLWANGRITPPGWIHWRSTVLLFPLLITLLHQFTSVWFWFRAKNEAKLRDGYRREILDLLGMAKARYPDRGFRLMDLAWMTWEGFVTLLIAMAVVVVVQNAVNVSK